MSKTKNEKFITQFLTGMTQDLQMDRQSDFFNKFYELKEVHYDEITPEILKAYKQTLKACITGFLQDKKKNTHLSAMISLSNNLIPADEFDVEMYDLFQVCLEQQDSRTKANTLIALGEYDPQSPLFKEHFDSKSNRVASDALLVEGKKGYSPLVDQKIELFLFSSNPFFVASAVYLVYQLTTYYFAQKKQQDLNWISQYHPRIEKYTAHPHEMVRKRSLQAIQDLQKLRSAS
jgi:hypothetical protein